MNPETLGTGLRWVQLCAGLGLTGGFAMMLMNKAHPSPVVGRWREGIWQIGLWQAWLVLISGCGLLMLQAWTASGQWAWADIERMLTRSHYGQVWQVRAGVAVALILLLACRRPLQARCSPSVLALLVLTLAVTHGLGSVFTGHAISAAPIEWAISAHLVHLLGAGVWAGGLPAMLAGLGLAANTHDASAHLFFKLALKQFSVVATYSVVLLVTSGAVMASLQTGAPLQWPGGMQGVWAGLFTGLERLSAPLLSTTYGQLVLFKTGVLGLVLLLAARVRWTWMPRLAQSLEKQRPVFSSMTTLVACELGLVLLLVLIAAKLGTSLPAAHAPMVWPFSWRLSFAATWDLPGTAWRVELGLALLALGSMMAFAQAAQWRRLGFHKLPLQMNRTLWGALLFVLGGLAVGLPALTVDAYPDTFRRSDSAYAAVSIAHGAHLYEVHCVGCHGANGKGDGPAAVGLAKPPANLTEPHTALHTAGDMYWWLTHGMARGGMPGFAAELTDQERWDMVNFLRAFSSGFQARILKAEVVPGRPWLAWPDLDFTTTQGAFGALKDYRERDAVLLVFYALPTSQNRLKDLANAYPALRAKHTEVLAIPWTGGAGLAQTATPWAQIQDGAADAVDTALLFRRTLSDPGQTVLGEKPVHMEILVDRFGYARSRWLPPEESRQSASMGWDLAVLLQQIDLIHAEPRLLPPPDEHVH